MESTNFNPYTGEPLTENNDILFRPDSSRKATQQMQQRYLMNNCRPLYWSLPRHEHYVEMPTLAVVVALKTMEIYQLLTHLPNSTYYGSEYSQLRDRLCENTARRHLCMMILVNDKYKADFAPIEDLGPYEESASA